MHERVTVLHHFGSAGAPGTSMFLWSPSSSRSSSAVSLCRELCRRRISWKQGNLPINEVAVFVCTCLFHLKHFPSSSSPTSYRSNPITEQKSGLLARKSQFHRRSVFLGKRSPPKTRKIREKRSRRPVAGGNLSNPVARWMFKKRNYSLGFFLGAR